MIDREKEQDRNWDQEMREVDRLLAKLPAADPQPSGGYAPTLKRPAAVAGAHVAKPTRAEWLGAWARVAFGVAIGVGMTQWPYTHGCGIRLIAYGVGIGAVFVAGVWSSVASWRHRLAFAHLLSQLLIIWALVLAAREVLPRVGYAKDAGAWFCP